MVEIKYCLKENFPADGEDKYLMKDVGEVLESLRKSYET
jgi:hypothetical protein